jgi:phosphatidylglycerophosphatase C
VRIETSDAIRARIADARASAGDAAGLAFDGDGTLWSGDVGEDNFYGLLDHGGLRPETIEALRAEVREFDLGSELANMADGNDLARGLYAAYLAGYYPEERTCEMMTWIYAGWRRADVEAFVRRLVVERDVAARIHPEVHDVITWARAVGLRTILVSASPREIVVAAGAIIGFAPEDIVAADAVYEDEVMCTRAVRPIPYGPGKVRGVRTLLGEGVLLAAFGDNAFDLAMLAEAKVPVAVRPKARLRDRAHEVPLLVEIASPTKG